MGQRPQRLLESPLRRGRGAGVRDCAAIAAVGVATVQALNFVIFLIALACFSAFLREAIRWIGTGAEEHDEGRQPIQPATLAVIGYTLFAWTTIDLVGLATVNADMLVAASVYLAAAFVIRLRAEPGRTAYALALGVVLGLGYLSKAAMFPIAPFFVIAAAVGSPRSWRVAALSAASFALVAAPLVVALDREAPSDLWRHRTAELPGRSTASRAVTGRGSRAGNGMPLHPTRRIVDAPPAFEFARPFTVTYAMCTTPRTGRRPSTAF